MTFKPAHKVEGDKGKPGQLYFDRHPYLKYSIAEPTPKKLTFDLWFNMRWHGGTAPVSIATAREIWKAAQENV